MKTIKATIPTPVTECFFYVGKPPVESKVDLPGKEIIFDTGKERIRAKLIDFIEYRISCMSEFHCHAAYGMTEKQMKEHLEQKFRLKENHKVAFYLFQKLQQESKHQNQAKISALADFK